MSVSFPKNRKPRLNRDAFTAVSECLIELEPMVRKYDEIDFLEAVLEIKRSKVSQEFSHIDV